MAHQFPSLQQAARRLSRLSFRQLKTFTTPNVSQCAKKTFSHHSTARPSQSKNILRESTSLQTTQKWQRFRPSLSQSRSYKTVEQAKSAQRTGPFSLKSALFFLATGGVMILYFQYEKARLERKRIVEMSKGVGRPKVGGPFTLTDLDGKTFTEADLIGKYSLVYFGFTHCPDICPDELDKMARTIDIVAERAGKGVLRPTFISCDPARDTPDVLRAYLAEFHDGLIGLTGTWEQTKNVCKQYRVYFSTPEKIQPGEDYLVDHSIYFYLMDPEGDFVECIGRQDTPESAAKIILDHVNDWRKQGKAIDTTGQ